MARKYQKVNIHGIETMVPTELVRDNNMVQRWEALNKKVEQAQAKLRVFEDEKLIARCREINEGLDTAQKSFKFSKMDGDAWITVVLDRQYMEFNHLAQEALAIIRKHIEDKEQTVPDEMMSFLKGLFLENRKLYPSEKLTAFFRMQFKNRDLKRAQELLKNSMQPRKSRSYVRYKKREPRA